MRLAVSLLCLLAFTAVTIPSMGADESTGTEEKKRGFLSRMSNIFSKDKKKEDEASDKKKSEEKKAEEPKSKPKTAEPPLKKPAAEKPPTPKLKPTSKSSETKSEGKPKPKSTAKDSDKSSPSKPKPKPEAKPEPKETAKAEEPKKEAAPAPKTGETASTTPAPKPADSEKPKEEPAKPEPPKETAKTDDKKDTKPAAPDADKAPKTGSGSMKTGGEFDDISSAFGSVPKPDVPTTPKAPQDKPPPEITASTLPPPPPLPASDGSWEVVKIKGHDFVTADSIQRFYRFNTLKLDGKHVWMRSPIYIVKADIGSQELLINNTKFILSDAVEESKGKALFSRLDLCKLIDPVLMPNHISTADVFDTVVVDAGHGGHDSGAKGIYGYEKDFALKMAQAVSAALKQRGFKTVLTRNSDEFISLPGRVEIANATPRSIFISLHFNSSGPSASGIETWALSPQGASSTFMGSRGWDSSTFTGNRRDSENIALATAVHAMVIHNLSALAERGMVDRSMVDRGIKRARWTVLTGCTKPGILFEGGFVTNATEGRLIAAQTYRDYVANSIADAVLNYRKALYPNVAKPSIKR